ncbi:uncharacterized protein UV8b_03551 [Ustilaginoidea virens]|uniref:Uncharacterized protein n=1 Tax=Ustilaginoidea virens TaxID=1159556 RepID=A0A8E5HPK5_USTVR|nr:uncharacterized protein UV8b_03551 [Ustilaginoidea virens]QUC19310.1 hypothetical protein UV8b_03551 [Ustilaginoidea virens]
MPPGCPHSLCAESKSHRSLFSLAPRTAGQRRVSPTSRFLRCRFKTHPAVLVNKIYKAHACRVRAAEDGASLDFPRGRDASNADLHECARLSQLGDAFLLDWLALDPLDLGVAACGSRPAPFTFSRLHGEACLGIKNPVSSHVDRKSPMLSDTFPIYQTYYAASPSLQI